MFKEPAEMMPRLTWWDLFRMFVRSFFIQTVWNFKCLQNVGWLYTLWPALHRLYPDPAERRKAAIDHLEYFNTHSYMANVIVGVVAGMEEEARAQLDSSRTSIRAAKKFMSGPLAALGDTVFWSALRPLTLLSAFVIGLLTDPMRWWVAPLFFLVAFNAFHLFVRAGGLLAGYKMKFKAIPFLTKFDLQKVARFAYATGMVVTVVALAIVLGRFSEGRWAAVGLGVASVLALRRGLSASTLAYIVVVLGVIIGYR